MARMNADERGRVFAEEAAVVAAQCLLQDLMDQKGWTRADMARAMNISRARVTQIFSDDCTNLTVRLLARAMAALGEELSIGACRAPDTGQASERAAAAAVGLLEADEIRNWTEISDYSENLVTSSANDNIFGGLADLRQARLSETYDLAA